MRLLTQERAVVFASGLSPKQFSLLEFIDDFMGTGVVPPTFDQMRTHMGFSSKGQVAYCLDRLQERGYLHRVKGKARSIKVLIHVRRTVSCPNCKHEFEPASGHHRRGETLDGSPVPRHAIEGEISEGAA